MFPRLLLCTHICIHVVVASTDQLVLFFCIMLEFITQQVDVHFTVYYQITIILQSLLDYYYHYYYHFYYYEYIPLVQYKQDKFSILHTNLTNKTVIYTINDTGLTWGDTAITVLIWLVVVVLYTVVMNTAASHAIDTQ
jgi:hypothetical protein